MDSQHQIFDLMYRKPLPRPTELSRPFWEGARQHQLRLQRCLRCGAFRFTPQALCCACYSEAYEWAETSGRGTIYSFTIIHQPQTPEFRDDLPYILAIVQLEEGPLMLTNLTGCAPDELAIGLPVAVQFEDVTEEITLYKFRVANR